MNGPVLRIFDANTNRAREAMRVIEDYARFSLDDAELSSLLKQLRHDLQSATHAIAADAIHHRNTPGDVGTAISTGTERTRTGLAGVTTAAGKRLGESLRAIEECLKSVDPDSAAKVEHLRYRAYAIEQRIARTLRPADRFADVRLCVLITESSCRRPWLETAEQAILGGADCLQLREKSMDGGDLLTRARQLVRLCRRYGVLCIINDRADVAAVSDADGVHLGQGDLPAAEVRRIVGDRAIVGISTHRIEQARQAAIDGADYIGVGPVFRSKTKPRDIDPGLNYVRQVASAGLTIPAIAIAGITEANAALVVGAGVSRVAVTAAVAGDDDPRTAAMRIRAVIGDEAVSRTPLEPT